MGRRRDTADVVLLDDAADRDLNFMRSWDLFVDGRSGLKNLGTDGGITVREGSGSIVFEGDRWSTQGSGLTTDGHTFGAHDWGTVPMSMTFKAWQVMEFGPYVAAAPGNRRVWSMKNGSGPSNDGYHIQIPDSDTEFGVELQAYDGSSHVTPRVVLPELIGNTEPVRVLFTVTMFQFFGVVNVLQMQVHTPTASYTSQDAPGPNADVDLTGIDGIGWGSGVNSQTTGPGGGPAPSNAYDDEDFEHVHVLGFGQWSNPPPTLATWDNRDFAALRRYYGIG